MSRIVEPRALSRRAALLTGLAAFSTPAFAAENEGDWTGFDDVTGHVIVDGTVNKAPARMLIDNGAQIVTLDRALAERAGVAISNRSVEVRGWTSRTPMHWTGPVAVAFGSFGLNAPQALALADAPFATWGEPEGRGEVLVGRQLFDGLPIEFDFANRRMAPRVGTLGTTGAIRLPLRKGVNGMRCVEVSIEGGPPVWALLDLGSNDPLSVDARLAKTRGLLKGRPVSTAAGAGVGGLSVAERATARTLGLGALTLKDVPFTVVGGGMQGADWSAVVGYPALSRLGRMIFDYPGQALWVFPAERASPFPRNRTGLSLTPLAGGGWTVIHVARGSPAARGPWKAGQTVAKVDGRPAFLAGEAFVDHPSGTRVTYEMADGAVRVIERSDFY
jgi:predicted aspartyl protease